MDVLYKLMSMELTPGHHEGTTQGAKYGGIAGVFTEALCINSNKRRQYLAKKYSKIIEKIIDREILCQM